MRQIKGWNNTDYKIGVCSCGSINLNSTIKLFNKKILYKRP